MANNRHRQVNMCGVIEYCYFSITFAHCIVNILLFVMYFMWLYLSWN